MAWIKRKAEQTKIIPGLMFQRHKFGSMHRQGDQCQTRRQHVREITDKEAAVTLLGGEIQWRMPYTARMLEPVS